MLLSEGNRNDQHMKAVIRSQRLLGEGQGEGGTGGELPAGSSCPGMMACTSTRLSVFALRKEGR